MQQWQKDFQTQKNNDALLFEPYQDQAMRRLVELGLPTRKMEGWRHTQLTELASFQVQDHVDEIQDVSWIPDALTQDANVIIVGASSVKTQIQDKGVYAWTLKEGLQDPTFENVLQQNQPHSYHPYFDFNSAFLSQGVCVAIAEKAVLSKPLYIFYDTPKAATHQRIRTLIHASEGSQASIAEFYVGKNQQEPGFLQNTATQINVDDRAHISLVKVQDLHKDAIRSGTTIASVRKDANLQHVHVGLGAQKAREDIQFHLLAQGAHVSLDGMYSPSGKQWMDHHLYTAHHVPQCTSSELFKGVLSDTSHAVFQGRIYVAKDAQQTLATQMNRNMLLSDQARVDTAPELEIFADDVRCAHGATIGKIDQDQLYYLCSRGISPKDAKHIMIRAFMDEVFEKIQDETLRTWVGQEMQSIYDNID